MLRGESIDCGAADEGGLTCRGRAELQPTVPTRTPPHLWCTSLPIGPVALSKSTCSVLWTELQLMKLLPSAGLVLVAIAGAALGCDLSEVEIPEGTKTIVVQAVMRPDLAQQFVVVEESFIGEVDYQVGVDAAIPTEGAPKTPIENAAVFVSNLDLPSDSCGAQVQFESHPQNPEAFTQAGVYWSPLNCPTMRPGDMLRLDVDIPGGFTVSGTAQVPGMNGAILTVRNDSLPFGTDSVTQFNRDRESLGVSVDAVKSRLLQIEVLRSGDLDMKKGEDVVPGAKIFAETTAVNLPGDLIDVFARGAGDDVFRAGRTYVLAAAVTDANYYDFARSSNNPYTGRGFINRLTGATGVFGSLVSISTPIKVSGEFTDEREGVYRLEGTIDAVDVDARITVYLARPGEEAEFSAFLDGDWFRLGAGPAGTELWVPWQVDSRAVDGTFDGNNLSAVTLQLAGSGFDAQMQRLVLRGIRVPGAAFRVVVSDSIGHRLIPVGTLTATQQ